MRRFFQRWRADAPARRNRADGTTCFYCGVTFEGEGKRARTVDHRRAKSRGGTDGLVNVVFACRACNDRKADSTEEDFLASEWLAARRRDLG